MSSSKSNRQSSAGFPCEIAKETVMATQNNLRFIINNNSIPVDAVIFIFRLGTHTKSDGDADDGEGIHNKKKKSVSTDCFSPEEKRKKKKKKMKVNGKRQSAKAHSIITTTTEYLSLNVHSVESVTVLDVYYHDDDDDDAPRRTYTHL